MRNKKTNKRQFTLIELIIVIVVIGILAGMALPKFIGVQRNANVAAMETDLDVIEKAVLQYVTATDDGSYPFLDTNGDKTINEEDLYFKTTNDIPKTLTDSLLNGSGDDGSKIYKLDMSKLEPYISKIKYPDTEYLYSEKSDTAIDPIGKADGDNFIHHIIGSGSTNNNEVLFSNKWTKLKSQSGASVTDARRVIETKDNNYVSEYIHFDRKSTIEKRDKNGVVLWTLEKSECAGIFEDDNGNLVVMVYSNDEDMINLETYTYDKELIETNTLSQYIEKYGSSKDDILSKTYLFETMCLIDGYVYLSLDMNNLYKGTIDDLLNGTIEDFEMIKISDENLTINKIRKVKDKVFVLGLVKKGSDVGTIYEYDPIQKTSKKVLSYSDGNAKLYDSEYYDVIVDNSGNYIFCGRLSNAVYRGFVEKYNSNLKLQFNKVIGDENGILMLENVFLTKDNGFIVTGSGTCESLSVAKRQSLIMKFNNKGEYENIWNADGLDKNVDWDYKEEDLNAPR